MYAGVAVICDPRLSLAETKYARRGLIIYKSLWQLSIHSPCMNLAVDAHLKPLNLVALPSALSLYTVIMQHIEITQTIYLQPLFMYKIYSLMHCFTIVISSSQRGIESAIG